MISAKHFVRAQSTEFKISSSNLVRETSVLKRRRVVDTLIQLTSRVTLLKWANTKGSRRTKLWPFSDRLVLVPNCKKKKRNSTKMHQELWHLCPTLVNQKGLILLCDNAWQYVSQMIVKTEKTGLWNYLSSHPSE